MGSKKRLVVTCVCIMAFCPAVTLQSRRANCQPPSAGPQTSYNELLSWLREPVDGNKLQSGKVYSYSGQAALEPFIPQPVWPLYFYPDMSMEVAPTGDYPIHKDFLEATAANQGRVTLDTDGELHGYNGLGFPFDPKELSPTDPQVALKVLWDFWYRPGHDDYYMPMETRLRDSAGNDGRVLQYVATEKLYIGNTGTPNGRLVPAESDVESKLWTSFEQPQDVRDTQMIITKYLDHRKDDDVVVFTRKERRARRMSAAERLDPWMGTDILSEDFYGFSGQVPEWKWQYVGRRKILATMNVRTNVDWGGPHGWVPQGTRWELRDTYVLAGTPNNPADPYGRRVLFIDAQRFWVTWMLGYDHDGRLWKNYQHTLAWSNDYHPSADSKGNPTLHYCHYEANGHANKILHVGETMVDVKKQEATLTHCYTCSYNMDSKEAAKHYSDQHLGLE